MQRSKWATAPHNCSPVHSIDPHGYNFRISHGLTKIDEAVVSACD